MKNEKDIASKRHPDAEARMIKPDFKVYVEKRSEEGMEDEKELTMIEGVGVVLDTLQQVESYLLMRHYDGLMKTGRIKGRTPAGATAV